MNVPRAVLAKIGPHGSTRFCNGIRELQIWMSHGLPDFQGHHFLSINRKSQPITFAVQSVLLKHNFSRFDDHFNFVTLFKAKLLRALARDHALHLILSDADNDMSHDVP
jgi:hypothetical protein